MTETIYLTPQQLAERYGVQVKTLQHWRWRTRKGKDYGPKRGGNTTPATT